MNKFIEKSKTYIYDINKKRYTHFELIEYLYSIYPFIVEKEIKRLKKLNKFNIRSIINKIPDELLLEQHKQLIYKYIIIRKERLLKIIKKGKK